MERRLPFRISRAAQVYPPLILNLLKDEIPGNRNETYHSVLAGRPISWATASRGGSCSNSTR